MVMEGLLERQSKREAEKKEIRERKRERDIETGRDGVGLCTV
jgi:hypothetical protein